MVNKCCVPGCTYNRGLRACFEFPSDKELREIWLNKIPRLDSFNTHYVGVCILHFEQKFIETAFKSGKPLTEPRLTRNAIPTIFNTNTDVIPVISVNIDRIRNFHHFKEDFQRFIDLKQWSVACDDFSVSLYKLKRSIDGNLTMSHEIIVNDGMKIKIFDEEVEMDMEYFKETINLEKSLFLFSDLQRIIEKLDALKDGSNANVIQEIKQLLKRVEHNVSKARNVMRNVLFKIK